MPIQVNGGIITDQMLAGNLTYFKMTGAFAYTVSDDTVTLASSTSGGNPNVEYYFLVGEGRPVPGSLASLALNAISDKCTITEIGVIGAPGAETAIHFSAENTSFGWIDAVTGAVDTAAMVAAIAALGATVEVPVGNGGAAGDITIPPVTANVSTTVVITEVPFQLA